MNDENTPLWIAPRSAIIVFRFDFNFGEVSQEASYADFAYAARVRLPTPHTSHSVAAVSSKPPYLRGEPAALGAATGIGLSIYFRDVPFIRLQVEIMR